MRKWTIPALLAALALSTVAQAQTDLRATQSVNVAKINGAAVPTGNGTAAGAQRVTVASDSTGTLAVTSTPAVSGNGTAATAARVTIASDSTGQVTLAAGSNAIGSATVTGSTASGATCSANCNPVPIGGFYKATQAAVTDGQQVSIKTDAFGITEVGIAAPTAAPQDSFTQVAYAFDRQAGVGNYRPLATAVSVWNGTNVIAARGDLNGTVTERGLSSTYWRYTSGTSPILSNTTTAVTIKAAAGASVKIALDACQLTTTAFGASVPLVIRDGAAGTVIFSLTVPTAGFLQPVVLYFDPPLVGTANTLMEVATPTADTSGTTTLNCQGHTAS